MLTAVDLFAGAGGSSTGARQAGARVLFAANHWATAIEVHQANHPDTKHACQDLHQIDWRTVPKHDLLLASPACQGHSRARGKDKPYHDALRSTAWAVTSCLETKRPRMVVVENVPEFREWELFPVWLWSIQCLGYQTTVQVLNSADFGVPQARQRLFVVGHREREVAIQSPGHRHIPAREIIDWDAGQWSPVEAPGRSERTLAQYRAGRDRHGERFLIAYYGSEKDGRSVDRPIGTITTVDRYAVVKGDVFRMLSREEMRRAMGFPEGYLLPVSHREAVKLLGNAVPPPMMAGIIRQLVS